MEYKRVENGFSLRGKEALEFYYTYMENACEIIDKHCVSPYKGKLVKYQDKLYQCADLPIIKGDGRSTHRFIFGVDEVEGYKDAK